MKSALVGVGGIMIGIWTGLLGYHFFKEAGAIQLAFVLSGISIGILGLISSVHYADMEDKNESK